MALKCKVKYEQESLGEKQQVIECAHTAIKMAKYLVSVFRKASSVIAPFQVAQMNSAAASL